LTLRYPRLRATLAGLASTAGAYRVFEIFFTVRSRAALLTLGWRAHGLRILQWRFFHVYVVCIDIDVSGGRLVDRWSGCGLSGLLRSELSDVLRRLRSLLRRRLQVVLRSELLGLLWR
jgi:hypothetical protein